MLSETHKIDLVTQEKAQGPFRLYLIIEAEEDYPVDTFERLLTEKANNYTSYFLDGQMSAEYPDLNQKKITLFVQSVNDLKLHYHVLISKLATKLDRFGIEVLYEKL